MPKMAQTIRQRITHNLGLKILSLLAAVGLWLAVARDPVAEVGVDIPIELNNLPQNLEVSSETIPRVQVRLRGPERITKRLQQSDVYAEIELENVHPGDHNFDITSRQIHQPAGLEVVQVVPSQFRVSFDSRLTRLVEVHPRVVGTFAPGYSIDRVVAVPAKVSISGPLKRCEIVDSAITDPIDVTGVLDHMTATRHAYVSDPLIQVTESEPVHVTVYMRKGFTPSGSH